ncbi:hypothetical protein ACFTTN_03380 [Streptomyces niveus]|uniref:hypothetical protein n=1 Tax=Streptomyces niveus TaxID=193462 RepID=UPI00364337A1
MGEAPAGGILTDTAPTVAVLALEMIERLLREGALALTPTAVRLCAGCGHMTVSVAHACRACGHHSSRSHTRPLNTQGFNVTPTLSPPPAAPNRTSRIDRLNVINSAIAENSSTRVSLPAVRYAVAYDRTSDLDLLLTGSRSLLAQRLGSLIDVVKWLHFHRGLVLDEEVASESEVFFTHNDSERAARLDGFADVFARSGEVGELGVGGVPERGG